MKNLRTNASERGFTLIELLVVIIILGILAAVVVFAVSGVGDKGKSSATVIDDRTIRTAEEAYCAQKGTYASGADLVAGGFLSEVPKYHEVNARQTTAPGSGNCNGWKYFITRTDIASPYGTGSWTAVASPPLAVQALVRLVDGRVFARFNPPGPNRAYIWDPTTNSWATQDPPPDTALSDNPSGAPDLLLVDDPSTPYSECKGIVDNCGKVLVFGSLLFDPTKPATGGVPSPQWQKLSSPSCNVCEVGDFRGDVGYAQIKGNLAQCGVNCGRIVFFPIVGNPSAPADSYDIFDPRDNSYQTFVYTTTGFSPPLNAQQVGGIFRSGAAALGDGRIFGCCDGPGAPRSAFMDVSVNPPTIVEGPTPPAMYGRASSNTSDSAPLAVLPSGDLFLTGVIPGSGPESTALYRPVTGGPGSFTAVPHCATTIRCVKMGALPDGRILTLRDQSGTTNGFMIFNPAARSWTQGADINLSTSRNRRDSVYLDPAGGPCGAYCGKVFIASTTASVFTP